MILFRLRASRLGSGLSLAALMAVLLLDILPSISSAQTPRKGDPQQIRVLFEPVSKLRASGEYDRAIERLQEIVQAHQGSEQVLRGAYNHLVMTYHDRGDATDALRAARQALEKFPDLVADENEFPAEINEYYEQLRELMFGHVTVKSEPAGCDVFLNGRRAGVTPLDRRLLKVGDYDLTLAKEGYSERTVQIRIQPGLSVEKDVFLKRRRGWTWWGYRVGTGVVALGLLALGLSGGDESAPPPEPEPLPPPPDPPGN